MAEINIIRCLVYKRIVVLITDTKIEKVITNLTQIMVNYIQNIIDTMKIDVIIIEIISIIWNSRKIYDI